jgi:hypothetical protein
MTDANRDIRQPLDDTPVEGIDSRLDQLLNERFRSLALAIIHLQQRTLIEPRSVPPQRAYDGQVEFADGVNWSPDGSGLPGMYYYWQGNWYALADNFPGKKHMQWYGIWSAGFFPQNAVVWDDGWLMICNNPNGTTDRAAPVPIGPLQVDLPDVPAWAEQQFLGVCWTGHVYTLTVGGWVQAIQVWAPELLESTNYRIILADVTDPNEIDVVTIEEPVLNEDAWTSISIGNVPYPPGAKIMVILDALNSGGNTFVTGGWTRSADENTAEPAAGFWNRRIQNDQVRINFTDLDSVDRQTELETIIAGSDISFTSTVNSAYSVTYHVDSVTTLAGSVQYNVTESGTGPFGSPPVTHICTMQATIPTPQTTKYVDMVGYWPANQPAFAAVEGVKRLGGVDQPATNDAFGCRIGFQEAVVSEDWDLMAYTDLASAGAVSQDDLDQIIDILGGV